MPRLPCGNLITFLAIFASTTNAVVVWGQCGGSNYQGSTQCDAGLSCVKLNDYYSQCQNAGGNPPLTTTAPGTVPPSITTTTTGSVTATAPPAPTIPTGALTKISNFGSNPSNVGIYAYKPAKLAANPGLVVALHWCGGDAQSYYSGIGFKALADQRGFWLLYGQAPASSHCWDVTSSASLTHDKGGDSLGIASAVRYAIQNWSVDPAKVFVLGTSSGAMMTNVMAGVYPDLFKAGAVFSGVALGCLVNDAPTNPPDPCAVGNVNRTPQQWADRVKNAYPGYTGAYPKMQIWAGMADNVVNAKNFDEEVKQWAGVGGIDPNATQTLGSTPKASWTKTVYGTTGKLEGYKGQNAGHILPESGLESVAIDFFGL